MLLLACPRSIALHTAESSADQLVDVCPGCEATQLSERMRQCQRCEETMCEGCVNDVQLCYMCDGAYPGATSSEQGNVRERERGGYEVGACVKDFLLYVYDPEWCERFRSYCGVFGRGPLMQLFTALLTVAASARTWFGRRGE